LAKYDLSKKRDSGLDMIIIQVGKGYKQGFNPERGPKNKIKTIKAKE